MTNIGGIIELDFPLADQVNEGDWTIRARHEKHVTEKTFRVVEYCKQHLYAFESLFHRGETMGC